MRKLFVALPAVVPFGGFTPSAHPADPSPGPPPDVAIHSVSGARKLTAAGGPRGVLVDVGGAYGDGRATLAFAHARPSRLTFRFGNLRGMHSFTLGDGRNTFGGVLGWAGGRTEAHFDRAGRRVHNAALAAVSTSMRAAAGGVEVTVRARGTELGKDLRVRRAQMGPWMLRTGFPDS
jgi:hypothetical protein